MELWDNVRTDLRLRNLTIYAQWASILAAVTMYCVATLELLSSIYWILRGLAPIPHTALQWVISITHFVSMFVFPLAPLAIELPHHIRRKPFLYASIVSWIPLPLLEILLGIMIIVIHARVGTYQERDTPLGEDIFRLMFSIVLLIGTYVLAVRVWTQDSPGLKTKVGVNLLYCAQLASINAYSTAALSRGQVTITWSVDQIYIVSAGIFGVAAILYGTAWRKGHSWVSSTVLGGTGIEPMILILPRRGHLYQSVGDEAREGVIRLV